MNGDNIKDIIVTTLSEEAAFLPNSKSQTDEESFEYYKQIYYLNIYIKFI